MLSRKPDQDANDPSFVIKGTSKSTTAYAAQKYNHVGSRGDGLKSALDRDIIMRNAQREAENFGSNGYSFRLCDEDGNDVEPTPLNFAGRLFLPDVKGIFTIKDHDLIKNEYEKYKEHEEYINRIMNFILSSDNVCKLTVKAKQWDAIKKAKCTPMQIRMSPPNSDKQAELVVLLRNIIELDPPIIEGMTSDKVENEK